VTWIGYRSPEFFSGLLFVTADTFALTGPQAMENVIGFG
jgi:hypothetical protein